MNNWIDKHSVNCYICGQLFDERDGVKLKDEGEMCPDCLLKQTHDKFLDDEEE